MESGVGVKSIKEPGVRSQSQESESGVGVRSQSQESESGAGVRSRSQESDRIDFSFY